MSRVRYVPRHQEIEIEWSADPSAPNMDETVYIGTVDQTYTRREIEGLFMPVLSTTVDIGGIVG